MRGQEMEQEEDDDRRGSGPPASTKGGRDGVIQSKLKKE